MPDGLKARIKRRFDNTSDERGAGADDISFVVDEPEVIPHAPRSLHLDRILQRSKKGNESDEQANKPEPAEDPPDGILRECVDVGKDVPLTPSLSRRPAQHYRIDIPVIVELPPADADQEPQLPVQLGRRTGLDHSGFGFGALVSYEQTRTFTGLGLGSLLSTVSLAPGEVTRIAVIDWTRTDTATGTEATGQTEQVSQNRTRTVAQDDVARLTAELVANGSSRQNTFSFTAAEGSSNGDGLLGFVFGGGNETSQSAMSISSATVVSSLDVTQDATSELSRRITDASEQAAATVRSRRATVVREATQAESDRIQTRVVANYNHMHTLNLQYFEEIERHCDELRTVGFQVLIFVPFADADFTDEATVNRYRHVLARRALEPRVARALLAGGDIVVARQLDPVNLSSEGISQFHAIRDLEFDQFRSRGLTVAAGPGQEPWALTNDVRVGSVAYGVTQPYQPGQGSSPYIQPPQQPFDLVVTGPDGTVTTTPFVQRDGFTDAILTNDRIARPPAWERAPLLTPGTTVSVRASGAVQAHDMFFRLNTNIGTITVAGTAAFRPGDSVPLFAVGRDRRPPMWLLNHLDANPDHYTEAVYASLTVADLQLMLAGYKDPMQEDRTLLEAVEPQVRARHGRWLGFVYSNDSLLKTYTHRLRYKQNRVVSSSEIALGSGSVFCEGVLGSANTAEELDMSRFWNWQDSPIPVLPPEITSVGPGSRYQPPDFTTGSLAPSLASLASEIEVAAETVTSSIVAAAADPASFTGLAGVQEAAANLRNAADNTRNIANNAGERASADYTNWLNAMSGLADKAIAAAIAAATGNPAPLLATANDKTATGPARRAPQPERSEPGVSNISNAGAALNEARRGTRPSSTSELGTGPAAGARAGEDSQVGHTGRVGSTTSSSPNLAEQILRRASGVDDFAVQDRPEAAAQADPEVWSGIIEFTDADPLASGVWARHSRLVVLQARPGSTIGGMAAPYMAGRDADTAAVTRPLTWTDATGLDRIITVRELGRSPFHAPQSNDPDQGRHMVGLRGLPAVPEDVANFNPERIRPGDLFYLFVGLTPDERTRVGNPPAPPAPQEAVNANTWFGLGAQIRGDVTGPFGLAAGMGAGIHILLSGTGHACALAQWQGRLGAGGGYSYDIGLVLGNAATPNDFSRANELRLDFELSVAATDADSLLKIFVGHGPLRELLINTSKLTPGQTAEGLARVLADSDEIVSSLKTFATIAATEGSLTNGQTMFIPLPIPGFSGGLHLWGGLTGGLTQSVWGRRRRPR